MKFFPLAFGALFDVPHCDPDGADRLGSDHVPRLVLHLSVVGVVIFKLCPDFDIFGLLPESLVKP